MDLVTILQYFETIYLKVIFEIYQYSLRTSACIVRLVPLGNHFKIILSSYFGGYGPRPDRDCCDRRTTCPQCSIPANAPITYELFR